MKRPIFYFERLKAWDIWTIAAYVIISLAVYINGNKGSLLLYVIFTQIFIYVCNYRSLRNLSVYLVWLGFGIVHFVVYLYLRNNPLFALPKGNAANALKDTIILLFVYQLLRILSLNIQHQEFVMPTRSGTDIFGERFPNWLDTLLFFLYMACVAGLIALG